MYYFTIIFLKIEGAALIPRKGPAAPLTHGFLFTPKRQFFQKKKLLSNALKYIWAPCSAFQ